MLTYSAYVRSLRLPYERSVQLRNELATREAHLVAETMLQISSALFETEESESAWVRAARQLSQLATPLSLDALAIPSFPVSAIRIDALVHIPDLTTIQTPTRVDAIIADAISLGAPTYNNGDPRGCAIIYWTTIATLTHAPSTSGFPGQTRILKTLRQAIDEAPRGNTPASVEDYAWHLRRALDTATAALANAAR